MGKGFLFFPLNLGGVIMRCPDCNKEVGSVSSCPYCGATISNNQGVEAEVEYNSTPIVTIDKSAKPLFSKSLLAFGLSFACIIIWYLFTSIISATFMGEYAKIAFTYSFGKKIIAIIFMGLLCSVGLAYSGKIKALSQKTSCIIICIAACIISYLLLAIVGDSGRDVAPEVYHLALISKRTLNFYFAFGIPLTCGSIFIASLGKEKKKAITNLIIICLITLILSCIISFITITVFAMGLQGLIFSCIVPIIVFIISMFLK